jgi:nitrite reductase/ring-hydroxylating ferredoxin subunit/uncharacterized membrane protein
VAIPDTSRRQLTPLEPLVRAIESAEVLDPVAQQLGKAVRGALPGGPVKDALSGTWLGHAVHPMLTDVVIGSFMSTTLLDLLGGDGDGSAANRLTSIGIAAYGPTALTGANDWADTEVADPAVRRVGLVHAAANVTALGLYATSLAARRNGARGRGSVLALAGAAVLTLSGYLGGHMSYTRGVGPNQTAFDPGPEEWTAVAQASELTGEPKAVVAAETPVFLVRHPDGIHAIHDRCSHRGCLLSDGELDGHVVICACHGSQFDITDGSVVRGPASAGQPVFEARETDGRIEVKLRSRG